MTTDAYDDRTPSRLTTQFGEECEVYVVTAGAPETFTVTFVCQSDPTPTPVAVTTLTTPRPVALTESPDGVLTITWVDDTGYAVDTVSSTDRGITWS